MSNLTQYRQDNGLTLRAFAARVGLSAGYLCEIEKGDKTPSLRTAHRIQEASNGEVTVSDLFNEVRVK